MESLKCPNCGRPMNEKAISQLRVWECSDAHGIYLDRAQLGSLVEAEHDWHTNAGQHTAPMPRITPEMAVPPPPPPRARAWVETLFS